MPRPFYSLSNRGQARRLRALAFEALKLYDLPVDRLRLITNSFNGIFRVDTRDGRKLVLRVTWPEGGHSREGTCAEMAWLDALSRQTSLRVPRPAAARSGELVVEAAADGVPQPRLVTIFSWVDGINLAERPNEKNLERLGYLMAQLHLHAANFSPPCGASLPRFDRVFPFPEPVVLFEPRFAQLFPPERRTVYEKAVRWAQGAIERLQGSGEPMRILHGDLHQWNVRVRGGVLAPIDFEDLMWGWPAQDIATSLYYFQGEHFEETWSAFKTGYTRHSPWPERYAGEIEAFIAARALMLVNFALQDPNVYWQEEAPRFVEKNEQRLRALFSRAGI